MIKFLSESHDGSVNHASSPGTSATVLKPAGLVNGGVMLSFGYVEDATSGALPGLSVPSGWTQLYDFYNTTAGKQYHALCHWKRALNEGASYVWSWTNNVWYNFCTVAYLGVSEVLGPVDVSATGTIGTNANINIPDVTTTKDNDMLVAGAFQWTAGAITPAAGWTERFDASDVLEVAERLLGVAGATGSATFTGAATNATIGIAVALLANAVQLKKSIRPRAFRP